MRSASCCGGGRSVELVEHRRAELMHTGVRQLHLRLDPRDLLDPESRGLPCAVAQERGLAHARLPPEEEDRAPPGVAALQQPVEHLTFSGPALERREAGGGHVTWNGKNQGQARASPWCDRDRRPHTVAA